MIPKAIAPLTPVAHLARHLGASLSLWEKIALAPFNDLLACGLSTTRIFINKTTTHLKIRLMDSRQGKGSKIQGFLEREN
ncbi:hypothetical protein [Nostoc sp. UIC 10630]|uniref:hypothetical protein n=1 Tax=Nostoc sp. UIC 10630 TaxID=2100146 RepID=UPI0013D15964|nr:hypothetical protein [Nostoc sp. UIC 10630]NEU79004.1 hypothetical protein [Nostoc sp. UIC 10630]